jgi:tetratricopeptide (TPR) repeat protein
MKRRWKVFVGWIFVSAWIALPIIKTEAGTNPGVLLEVEADPYRDLLDRGRNLRDRRLFDQALETFQEILQKDPLHLGATFEIAETYYKAHLWEEAVEWFDIVTLLDPQNRPAFAKRWRSLIYLAGEDSLLIETARYAVRREIAAFLKKYPWDWETLETAYQGAAVVGDSLLKEEIAGRILLNFPNSPAGYRITRERFYEGLNSTGGDKNEEIAFFQRFLGRHRRSDFQETVWRYLTRTLFEMRDTLRLRSALNRWMSEDPDNPLPYERATGYLLEIGVTPDSLLPLARLAVDKCRGWRGKPLKPVEQRLSEGKELYAFTRLNMARVLLALGRTAEAHLWLEDGLKRSGLSVDDNLTDAPFYYYFGLLYEREGDLQEALDAYLRCLIRGDDTGKWTIKAHSAAERLFRKGGGKSGGDLIAYTRRRFRYDGPVFDEVTSAVGLENLPAKRVAWGDVNGDGFDDLLLDGKRLFLNREGRFFSDITDICGLNAVNARLGVWADVDLDGDLDLFCSGEWDGVRRDYLFVNRGGDEQGVPLFEDASEVLPRLPGDVITRGAAWGDLQGDGRPDLYLADGNFPEDGKPVGAPDYLLVNLPDEGSTYGFRFSVMGPDSGLVPPFGEDLPGIGVLWWDFNGDGNQDIFVSNGGFRENILWENGGDGSLYNRASFYGLAGADYGGKRGWSRGVDGGDFDGDGDLDLLVLNRLERGWIGYADRTMLFENRLPQDGLFADVRRRWGIRWNEIACSPLWADFDGDGDLDLYLTSDQPGRRSFFYLNDIVNRRFHDRTFFAGVRVLDGYACAYSDFDRDGDLDLAVASPPGVRLFSNRGSDSHWLKVRVDIPGSGFGTRVKVTQGGRSWIREVRDGKGIGSQSSPALYFGLGDDPAPVEVKVRFPSGKTKRLTQIAPDREIILHESR